MNRNRAHASRIVATVFVIFTIVTLVVVLKSGSTLAEAIVVVTALIGAFALYAESRRGKTIAMGEFILNLNSEFDSHPGRAEVHKKIVSGAELVPEDQPAIVAYLTFFEIVYRLVLSGMLEMNVIDDLFRSRFFKAVHNVDIQELELLPDADGYSNIYKLEQLWLVYLKRTNRVLRRGERRLPHSARRRAFEQKRFDFELARPDEVASLHTFITTATEHTPPQDFFLNDVETLASQMRSGFTMKALEGNNLVGLLHVHFPDPEASYAKRVGHPYTATDVAHMDIGAVHPCARGYGLLELLLQKAEDYLRLEHSSRTALYATVSPSNGASQRSFQFAGYTKVDEVTIHHSHPRHVVHKLTRRSVPGSLPAPAERARRGRGADFTAGSEKGF